MRISSGSIFANRFHVITASVLLVLGLLGLTQTARAFFPVPPYLVSFEREYVGQNMWNICGEVQDDDFGSCIVYFGEGLEHASCWVNSDGTYSLVLWLPPGTGGPVSARVQDGDGLWSNERYNDIPTYFFDY